MGIRNDIIKYIEENYDDIEKDMNKRNSTSRRKNISNKSKNKQTRKKREVLQYLPLRVLKGRSKLSSNLLICIKYIYLYIRCIEQEVVIDLEKNELLKCIDANKKNTGMKKQSNSSLVGVARNHWFPIKSRWNHDHKDNCPHDVPATKRIRSGGKK